MYSIENLAAEIAAIPHDGMNEIKLRSKEFDFSDAVAIVTGIMLFSINRGGDRYLDSIGIEEAMISYNDGEEYFFSLRDYVKLEQLILKLYP